MTNPPAAPPAKMPRAGHGPSVPAADPSPAWPTHALQQIFYLIRTQTGHDFSLYKRNTVCRRIGRRMSAHQLADFTHYVRFLQETPAEVTALFRELLIGVTRFFRDPEAFERLQAQLRPLLRQKPAGSTVRVWAPGCSTGEEAYSLAMLLFETLDGVALGRQLRIQVFATDISPDAIDKARAGAYATGLVRDVSPARLRRFFEQTDGGYRVRPEVRDAVVFAEHDLNRDAPFSDLDVLVCRNLLIYFGRELQKKLIPVFHHALNPGGLLLLGPSENLTDFPDLFQTLDVKWKLSRRLELPAAGTRPGAFSPLPGPLPLPARPLAPAASPPPPAKPPRPVGPCAPGFPV